MKEKILKRFAWFLFALGILILLLLGFTDLARAQGNAFPPDNGPYETGQYILLPQNAVPLITSASVSPTTSTGATRYYYWIVTHDITNARFSIPAGPFFTNIGPAALSVTASIGIQWTPYTLPITYGQGTPNGTSFTAANILYDVLETATPAQPSGACNCAVEIGSGNPAATDTGSYLSYTVNVPVWPGNYPANGNLAGFGPKGSLIDSGSVIPPATPDVVMLTTTFQAAQNTLPSTGGIDGIGGGTIDARNCTNLSPASLDFGTFTVVKPLTILLGPCLYNFTRILVTTPGGIIVPLHMYGCGLSCSVLDGTNNTTVGQSLITQAGAAPQVPQDIIFQDLAIFPSGTAGQDVFNFTLTNPFSALVIQRVWFGGDLGGVTGSAIKIDASAVVNGPESTERILIDDNLIELLDTSSAALISLIGAVNNETRITQNHFETASGTNPTGTGILLASASVNSFPQGVVIESNSFNDVLLTAVEVDGAVGTIFSKNTYRGSVNAHVRNGLQMQAGTGPVHSSMNLSHNTFTVSANDNYILKTTDALATATFTDNTISGTPVTVFSGFTNNLVARDTTGGGFDLAQWEPILFANLATPPNGTFRYCSNCALTNPCTGSGTGAFAQRVNGAWNCAPVPTIVPGVIAAYSVTLQGADVPLTGSVGAVTITKAVTMPATGCPCRVLANWTQYMTTTGSVVVSEEWVSDATNNFAESEWPIDTNNGPSGTGSGMSPVTYANAAVVTFTLHAEVDGSSVTARAAPFHAFGLRNSRLELTVIPSN